MKVWIVNDDADDRRMVAEDVFEALYVVSVQFESLFDAHRRPDSPDLLIIDMSSVAPLVLGCAAHHYGPICTFLEARSGVTVIITSAVSQSFAEGVKDDVLRIIPEVQIHVVEYPWHTKLIDTLRKVT